MEVSKYTCCLFLVKLFATIFHVQGSGSLYDPPNRAVMWKYGFYTQKNYNYMQLNCGGEKQPENGPWKCGICGDPYDQSLDHEKGGKYGSLMISRYYPAGIKEMSVKIELLAFEKGFFEFRICPANNNTVTQECLDENILPIKEGYLAGTPLRFYPKGAGDFRLTVAIPPNLTCERCVLQWRYHTANSWGTDPVTQKQGLGFGPQEEFRNCADVRIGGAVPKSVRENPFFAPPDQMSTSTIDRPTEQRKKLASNSDTFVTSPEAANRFSPAMKTLLDGVKGLREIVESRSGNISSGSGHNISSFVERKLDVGNQILQNLPDIHTSGKSVSNVQLTEEKKPERTRMNLMPNFAGTAGGSLHGSIQTDLAANDHNVQNLDNVLSIQGNRIQDASADIIHIGGSQTELVGHLSAGTDAFGGQLNGNSGTLDIFNDQGQMSGGVSFTGSTDVQIDGMGSVGNIDGSFVKGSDISGTTDSERTLASILTGNADRQRTTFIKEIDSRIANVDGGTGSRISEGRSVAEMIDSQMTGKDSLADTAKNSFVKTAGLTGGIHVSSGKGSQILGAEGSTVKTMQTTGEFQRRMLNGVGSQTDAGTRKVQFSSTSNLQKGHGDQSHYDKGLTNDIMNIAAGIVGMDKGGENLQAGSIEQRIITQDSTGKVSISNDILPGEMTGGIITDKAIGANTGMNIQPERTLGVLGTSGVGPAPMPNKKSNIFVEGASIRKAEKGVKKGNVKAATRSGFALTGMKTASDTATSDFRQQMNNMDKTFKPLLGRPPIDLSQQGMTVLESMEANSNFNSGFSKSFSQDRGSKSPTSDQIGSIASGVDRLAFPDQIVPDLAMDGTHSNAISDKLNGNLDKTENTLKQQLVQDITLNANANFRPRELIVDGQRVIAKNTGSQQKLAAATDINEETGTSGLSHSGPSLSPPSGRQRIFLVRASRPQTVLLSNSADSSNRGMTLSETSQPNADFVSAPISIDKTIEATLSKPKVAKTVSSDAASTMGNTGMISSIDASNMHEPIVNSLNPSDKSSMMLKDMTASEVIDPLRTQSIRSNGTIAGEREFLDGGHISLKLEKTAQNRNHIFDGGNKVVNEIDAFRNELVKGSLKQGGALTTEKSKNTKSELKVATSGTNENKQLGSSVLDGTSLLISNEVGEKSETAGLGETVNNLLNEAQKLLSTTADFTSSQTVNIEGATGNLGKEETINTNARTVNEPNVPVSTSQSVVATDSTLASKEPVIHTHAAGGFGGVLVTSRDGLPHVDVHGHSTEILNIADLIGSPSKVHDLHDISTKTVKIGSEQTSKPEVQGTSGVIVFGSTAHSTGANVDASGSQVGTKMLNNPPTKRIFIDQNQGAIHQDNVGISEQNVIDQRGQFDTLGSSSFTGLLGNTESTATRQEQPAFGEPNINTLTGKTLSDSHGRGSLTGDSRNAFSHTFGGDANQRTLTDRKTTGRHVLNGRTMTGTKGPNLLSDTPNTAHIDISTITSTVGGSVPGGVIADTRLGDSGNGVRTTNVLSNTLNDGMTSIVFRKSGTVGTMGSNVATDKQLESFEIGSLLGNTESAARLSTNNMDTIPSNVRSSTVVGSDARSGGLMIDDTFDTRSILDENTVSGAFDERLVFGSLEGSRANGPAVVDRLAVAGSVPDNTNIMTDAHRSDIGQNIDTVVSSGIGGKIIDFSSSSQRSTAKSPDFLMRQTHVPEKLQGINQQMSESSSRPTSLIISKQVLDLRNVKPRQPVGSNIGLTRGSNSGESGNIGRVESVSTSSERINRTVSVQRQRNISGSRSGRRVIGGNNIVTTGRQATTVPVQRHDSAAERMNIERQINAFNLQDIPSSPVIDAGVQMSGDGSMTAGFGPRGREMFGERMEERRLMSREDRRRGMLRGDSGRRNEGRSEDAFRIVRDPRTGLEERIPVMGRIRIGERIDRVIVQGRDGRFDAGGTGPEYVLDMRGGSPESRMSVLTEPTFRDRGTGSTGGRIIEIRDMTGGSSRDGASFDVGSGGLRSTTESRGGDFRTDAVRSERDFSGERIGERLDGRTMLSTTRDAGDRRMTSTPVMSPSIISSGDSIPRGGGFSGGSMPTGGGFSGGSMPTGASFSGGSMPTVAGFSGGTMSTGGGFSGGSMPTGGGFSGGTMSTGGGFSGGSMPTGGGFSGGTMSTGGGFSGGSMPTGGGFSGGSMPTGGGFSGGSMPTGAGFSGGTMPTGAGFSGGSMLPGGGFSGGMPPFSGSFPMMGPGPGPMMGGPMGGMPFDSGMGPRFGPGIGPGFGPGMGMGGGMPTFPSLGGFGPGMI